MKILTIIGTYLPGYKAGGPIRSIANLVDRLGDEYKFYILTSDRDLGDEKPYPGVERGGWYPRGKAQVLYLPPQAQGLFGLHRILRTLTYDLIYLNSFFSLTSIEILLLRRLGLIPPVPVVLAPRGEFSPGALAIKSYKKNAYLALSNLVGLYQGIRWQASSAYEAEDIRKSINRTANVILAAPVSVSVDPNPVATSCASAGTYREAKNRGELRIVFLSRISRKKNLDFALNLLGNVKGNIYFDIYGPIEDQAYWQECQILISKLPAQIHVQYCGTVPHQEVAQVFSRYHLFLFPTHGENFGHVILESLSGGCPILISNQTPWHDLERHGGGWDVPLSDAGRFQALLEACVGMDQAAFNAISASAHTFATMYLQSQDANIVQAYRELFYGNVPVTTVNQAFKF